MSHQITVRDAFGNKLTEITAFSRLEYMRAENKVGWLTLTLDPNSIDTSIFSTDTRLEPWRQVGANAPYLDGETPFFLRKWGYKIDSQNVETFTLECKDSIDIIDRHIAAYPMEHLKDEITSVAADDGLKLLVKENMGASVDDATRDLSTYITVQANLTLGAVIYKQYAWQNILGVMQEICADSFKAGTYLVFDLVYVSPTMMEFRTYAGARGTDHGSTSGSTLIISREAGNLEQPELVEDHSDEKTVIYATGPGEGSAQVIETAIGTVAMGKSPFNRCEQHVPSSASGADVVNLVQAEANAGLTTYRVRKSLTGIVRDTSECLYGVHYRFGDIVYATYRGQGYNAHVDAIHITVEQGRETIDNHLRAES